MVLCAHDPPHGGTDAHTYVVTAWTVGVSMNYISGHMTAYSDAKVVEVTAHLGVLR